MEAVRRHLESVLASDPFRRSPVASAILRYLVGCAVAKTAPKEYAIATEALGRPASFDPRVDPAVRVEVRRLRQKLLEFYAAEGRGSELTFDLPKGGYALTWRRRDREPATLAIAVLPFTNLTGDPSKEYFADGLTEELTSELARASDMRVVARTSAFAFKGQPVDVREIGRRLGVSTLVEGSIRWNDGRVRATVQLIEAEGGFHRWAHSYEADERDLLGCQLELAARIREALLLCVAPGTSEPGAASPPAPEAYLQFLRARYHWHMRTPEGTAKALRLLEDLTTRFPRYAAPWAARAEGYCVLGLDGPTTSKEFGDQALVCSERALALAPDLAEAHAARGWTIGQYRFDHAGAAHHFARAIELKPGYLMARYVWGMAACVVRRFDDALRCMEIAAELDPLSMVAHRGVAYVWFVRRDFDRAREHVLQALDLAPRAAFATYLHGLIEAEAGDIDRGVDLLGLAVVQAGGNWPLIEGFMAYYQARAGRPADAAAIEQRIAAAGPANHIALALAALGRGDSAQAIGRLELAAEAGDPFVVHIANLPPFPQLTGDAGARALYRRLNLPVGHS